MAALELHALVRDHIDELRALLPTNSAPLSVRLVEPMHVLSMRWLPGGGDAVDRALANAEIPSPPDPGRFAGDDPYVLWRSLTELMFITARAEIAEQVRLELAPALDSLAYAIDQSDGLTALELEGPSLDQVLFRLMDASAVPLEKGRGSRMRMAEIAVFALRVGPQRAWLIADRANDQYLARWVAYAAEALAADSSTSCQDLS